MPHREDSRSIDAEKASSPDTEPLWTVEDVASYLRLKPDTVRAMARRGELPAVKIGKVWRFDRSSINKLVSSAG
jgi:excisionase family DNA binding protein